VEAVSMSEASYMTAREASEHLRREGSLPVGVLGQLRDALTPEQIERIEAKCQWEHCSWLAVLRNWPNLFEPEALR
jgi:hypothetical protein